MTRIPRFAALAGALLALPLGAAPFVPRDDAQVLERLRDGPLDPAARDLRALRARLQVEPRDAALAVEVARRCLALARRQADPRFLGCAQAALSPWWSRPEAPPFVLVARALVRQTDHRFEEALADLDTALRASPRDAQAWLAKASILLVVGRPDESRRACAPLLTLAPALVALTCVGSADGLSGRLAGGRTTILRALEQIGAGSEMERAWAHSALAEMAVRAGDDADAEAHFRAALSAAPPEAALLAARADYLLDRGRAAEVLALLEGRALADVLLLRLALAEKALGAPELATHTALLQERFEEARRRGDVSHRREEARFRRALLGDARGALRLALENWQAQREPADARILLESALDARDAAAAAPVLEHVGRTRIEDVHLAALASALRSP